MDLRIKPIPEEHQKGNERYAVMDWDTEPGIPWDCFATIEEAESFIAEFTHEIKALETIKPRVEAYITDLAEELKVDIRGVADQVGNVARDICWPTI